MTAAPGTLVGRGELATAFARRAPIAGALVVAAGVSDSSCADEAQFTRERTLLRDCIARAGDRALVYFGSCGVVAPELAALPYYRHKLAMEALVREAARRPMVVRLPQLVGRGDNRRTIVNAFHAALREGREITVHCDARRYFIDVEDVVEFVRHAVGSGALPPVPVDVACPQPYAPLDLVRALEAATGLAARVRAVAGGVRYPLDTAAFAREAANLGWDLGPDYLGRAIARHYGPARGSP